MAEGSRECGGCTACCEGWLTDKSLNLKPGSPCPNKTTEGCGIYETRPERPCRSFTCAWLQRPEEFPEELRPDKSGAICMVDRDWYDWSVLRASPVGESIPETTFDWLLSHAKEREIPLFFLKHSFDGDRWISTGEKALGPAGFAEEVKMKPNQNDVFWGLGVQD